MTTSERLTTKEKMLRAIESLPEDATIDDGIDCLIVVQKIEAGREEVRQGKLIPHAEVKKQFAQWLQ